MGLSTTPFPMTDTGIFTYSVPNDRYYPRLMYRKLSRVWFCCDDEVSLSLQDIWVTGLEDDGTFELALDSSWCSVYCPLVVRVDRFGTDEFVV